MLLGSPQPDNFNYHHSRSSRRRSHSRDLSSYRYVEETTPISVRSPAPTRFDSFSRESHHPHLVRSSHGSSTHREPSSPHHHEQHAFATDPNRSQRRYSHSTRLKSLSRSPDRSTVHVSSTYSIHPQHEPITHNATSTRSHQQSRSFAVNSRHSEYELELQRKDAELRHAREQIQRLQDTQSQRHTERSNHSHSSSLSVSDRHTARHRSNSHFRHKDHHIFPASSLRVESRCRSPSRSRYRTHYVSKYRYRSRDRTQRASAQHAKTPSLAKSRQTRPASHHNENSASVQSEPLQSNNNAAIDHQTDLIKELQTTITSLMQQIQKLHQKQEVLQSEQTKQQQRYCGHRMRHFP